MGEFSEEKANEIGKEVKETLENCPIVEDPNAGKKRWICTICGYVHTGDEPPEACPVCKQPSKMFKEM